MKRLFYIAWNKKWQFTITLILLVAVLGSDMANADSSGLSIKIALDQDQFPLGIPIALKMIISNDSEWDIYTKKGFSQTEFYKSLILTDPNGAKRIYIPATIPIDTMPPPMIYANRQVSLAEKLLPGAVKTVTIDNLATLFPVVNTVPGWYTLQVQQPFLRYAEVLEIENFGVLGFTDDPQKWQGTVNSNKIQFYLYPASGGQLNVRVLDNSVNPPVPLFQVPLKVFNDDEIAGGASAMDIWTKVKPVLEGKTDNQGEVVWAVPETCLIEDNYTMVARYADDFQQSSIAASDSGWSPGCSGIFTKELVFGEPVVEPGKFVIFALNSLELRLRSVVFSGNIGAKDKITGPGHKPQTEVVIGQRVELKSGVQVYGDSVRIDRKASVQDVYYNELINKGEILGEKLSPLDLPVWQEPPFVESHPGAKKVTLKNRQKKDLAPGAYGDVKLYSGAKLQLSGGEYHFRDLSLGTKASIVCLAPSIICIQKKFSCDAKAFVGPSSASGLSAKDLVIYIGGVDGSKGHKGSFPHAAIIGFGSNIQANLYVPNGSLWIEGGSDMTGSFIARDVLVGAWAKVSLDGAF